ncbi:hypothetical protein BV20DRAFT_965211 [Pilatotrama ljubarskyi]|nr:hypothetical protein BV20DRAFT_965211 [Pilatotrama ljubarskyi]
MKFLVAFLALFGVAVALSIPPGVEHTEACDLAEYLYNYDLDVPANSLKGADGEFPGSAVPLKRGCINRRF